MKSNNFEGKVAFVTGAASGIGRATAIAMNTSRRSEELSWTGHRNLRAI